MFLIVEPAPSKNIHSWTRLAAS